MDGAVGGWVQSRWPHRTLAWARLDGVFWLLRLVNERERIGSWKDGEVPVTIVKEEKLGVVEVVEGRIGVSRVPSRLEGGKELVRVRGGSEFGPVRDV